MMRTFAIAAALAGVMMTDVAASGQPAVSAAPQTAAGLLSDQQAGVTAQHEERAGKKFTTTVILEPASRRR